MSRISEYQRKLDAQIQDELNERGVGSLPPEEVPLELLEEATEAAVKIVGEKPRGGR